jgi:hypothetical protein
MNDCKIFTESSKNEINNYINNLLNKNVDLIVKGELYVSGILKKFRNDSYIIVDKNNSKFKFEPDYLVNELDAVKKNILIVAD